MPNADRKRGKKKKQTPSPNSQELPELSSGRFTITVTVIIIAVASFFCITLGLSISFSDKIIGFIRGIAVTSIGMGLLCILYNKLRIKEFIQKAAACDTPHGLVCRITLLKEELDNTKNLLSQARRSEAQVNNLRAGLERREEEHKTREASLTERESELQERRRNVTELSQEVRRLERELSEKSDRLTKADTKAKEAATERRHLAGVLEETSTKISDLDQELRLAKDDKGIQQTSIGELQTKLGIAMEGLERTEATIASLNETITGLRNSKATAQGLLTEERNTSSTLRTRLESQMEHIKAQEAKQAEATKEASSAMESKCREYETRLAQVPDIYWAYLHFLKVLEENPREAIRLLGVFGDQALAGSPLFLALLALEKAGKEDELRAKLAALFGAIAEDEEAERNLAELVAKASSMTLPFELIRQASEEIQALVLDRLDPDKASLACACGLALPASYPGFLEPGAVSNALASNNLPPETQALLVLKSPNFLRDAWLPLEDLDLEHILEDFPPEFLRFLALSLCSNTKQYQDTLGDVRVLPYLVEQLDPQDRAALASKLGKDPARLLICVFGGETIEAATDVLDHILMAVHGSPGQSNDFRIPSCCQLVYATNWKSHDGQQIGRKARLNSENISEIFSAAKTTLTPIIKYLHPLLWREVISQAIDGLRNSCGKAQSPESKFLRSLIFWDVSIQGTKTQGFNDYDLSHFSVIQDLRIPGSQDKKPKLSSQDPLGNCFRRWLDSRGGIRASGGTLKNQLSYRADGTLGAFQQVSAA